MAKSKTRRSATEWAREVATWRRSGQSARAYARAHGLKASTLTWWGWKVDREGLVPDVPELKLLPVSVADEETGGSGHWELTTANGHRLRGDGALEPQLAAALVTAALSRHGEADDVSA